MEETNAISEDIADVADADGFSPQENWLERLFRWASEAIVLLLMTIVGIELIMRGIFGLSLQFTAELGGYALIAITFLTMPACLVNHAFHRVHFVEARSSARGRAWLRLAFDSLSFVVTIILVWYFARFELITWRSGDVAPTNLMTPFWIPRMFMIIGVLGLAVSVARTIHSDLLRLRDTAATK